MNKGFWQFTLGNLITIIPIITFTIWHFAFASAEQKGLNQKITSQEAKISSLEKQVNDLAAKNLDQRIQKLEEYIPKIARIETSVEWIRDYLTKSNNKLNTP